MVVTTGEQLDKLAGRPDEGPTARILVRPGSFPNDDEHYLGHLALGTPPAVSAALELADDRLEEGEASHYHFLVGEVDGQIAGYACWGPIPGTVASADLYWIVVRPGQQGKGVGAELLAAAEETPGELLYTTTGVASNEHFAMVAVQEATGAEFAPVHFPDGGGAPKTAFLGGDVELYVANVSDVV